MDALSKQLQFLLCLGAKENQTFGIERCGIVSDMLAYVDNERLFLESGSGKDFYHEMHSEVDQLSPDVLDVAVDGTLFPAEDGSFEKSFVEIVYEACDAVELQICFDGYCRDEAAALTDNQEEFLRKLSDGSLEYSYVTHQAGYTTCVMTELQVQKLAELSIEMGIYSYFDQGSWFHRHGYMRYDRYSHQR